jgi:serine/threonine-protein kinase RsbT
MGERPDRARANAVRAVLSAYVSPMTAQSVFRAALHRAGRSETGFERTGVDDAFLRELRRGVSLFLHDEQRKTECLAQVARMPADPAQPASAPDTAPVSQVVEVVIRDENGIVDARTRARGLAAQIGFCTTDQYKLATAVSELSRNIFRYAGAGMVRLAAIFEPRSGMLVVARDKGPGISNLALVLSTAYRSKTGLGRGLQGCKKIVDEFEVDTAPGKGTTVTLRKYLWA